MLLRPRTLYVSDQILALRRIRTMPGYVNASAPIASCDDSDLGLGIRLELVARAVCIRLLRSIAQFAAAEKSYE